MNILYINNEMTIGGVAKCILKLSKELRTTNKIFISSKKTGALLKEFEKININNYPIRDVASKMPHNIFINVIRLISFVKKEKIDIIHSHHRMTTLLAKIVSKFTGVKVIHTQHLCIEDKFKLTQLALKNLKVITVSEEAKKILIEKSNLKEENIVTIYNTIETECQNKVVDSKLLELKRKGYFVVAQISRLVDYKGVFDFIEVARNTLEKEENIRFVLIGDGPEFKNLEKKLEEYDLKEKVFLLGSKDNVITQLKYIDLVLLCSYIEGLPLVPLEAFSQGIPVVGTNIGGTNEEIQPGVNGYLVEVKDIKGFTDRILDLYNDKNNYKKLSDNSIKVFEQRFNEEAYKSKHIEVYKT